MKRALASILFLSLPSCAWFNGAVDGPERFHTAQLEGELTPGEQSLFAGRQPRLGIALSGGGVRSAFYTAGALEALYERGILQRADIVSTVSGGGYTAYWLYAGQIAADDARRNGDFGSALLGTRNFPRSMCDLSSQANFVTVPQMIRAAVTGRARQLYSRRIGEVFGRNDRGLDLADVGRRTREGFPYLIVNASVDRAQATDWLDGLYEFSGVGTRGAGRDEVAWRGRNDASSYRRAVTISGAAFAPFLKQRIPEPPVAGAQRSVTLDDGGATENLGAIALIRRGVPNIVIIDAEHDPRYEFGAYVNLKNRLPRWGANIIIPGIEAHLAADRHDSPAGSYFRGTVTGRRGDGSIYSLQIYYIKMSYGRPLRDQLNAQWGGNAEGPQSWQSFYSATRPGNGSGSQCAALAQGEINLTELSGFAVQHYGEWWNRQWRAGYIHNALALNFPQYSTADQSMYVDQAPAFIGLGYLQASELPGIHQLMGRSQ